MGIIEALLVNKGLYDGVDITVDDLEEIEKYLSESECAGNTIDCYCIHCGTNRVFKYSDCKIYKDTGIMMNIFDDPNVRSRKPRKEEIFKSYLNKRYVLTYHCARDRQHSILFDLIVTDDKIIKIGQFPSVADLAVPEIAKYKSVLGNQYRELSKAIGLFAHGIGIGSFVYLRRIIENLVFNRFEQVVDKLSVSKEDFLRQKFDGKIETLKDYLPPILVQNKNVYGIVSKGIHELSEDECITMFPFVKAGIELMLDELIAEKERKEKEKVFMQFVAQKAGELK